jgi:hypothetical protein
MIRVKKLDPRAERIVEAGCLLYGERWQRKLAAAAGLSHQIVSCVSTGAKPVTDGVEKKVADALQVEIKRLGKTSAALQAIHRAMLK